MRIAIAGKGGAGKTSIAATLARLLARSGRRVVAVDADSNPNLGVALGVPPERAREVASLPTGLVSRRLHGPALTEPVHTVLERFATPAPDGVRLFLMGGPAHADEGCLCSAHATISAVLADLGDQADMTTIVDMEASPEHLSRGTARHVDLLLLVTEPYYRSLETVRRLASLARELPIPRVAALANKVRSSADTEAVGEFCTRHDVQLLGAIPWSDAVVAADLRRVPVIDSAAYEMVEAVSRLADAVLDPVLPTAAGANHRPSPDPGLG